MEYKDEKQRVIQEYVPGKNILSLLCDRMGYARTEITRT